MKVEVRGRLLLITNAMRDHVERRLHASLGRFASRLTRATVRVGDANGPRGGVDKICRIAVMLPGSQELVVEDVDSNMYVAIDRAAERASRAVERRLARYRHVQCTMAPLEEASQ